MTGDGLGMIRRFSVLRTVLIGRLSLPPMEPSELMLPVVTEENACLPLSVNVVARYWGVEIPLPREAAKRYPSGAGSVLMEGMELAEAHGLAVTITNTDVQGLMRAIDMGVPPIVVLPGVGGLTHHLSVISDTRRMPSSTISPRAARRASTRGLSRGRCSTRNGPRRDALR